MSIELQPITGSASSHLKVDYSRIREVNHSTFDIFHEIISDTPTFIQRKCFSASENHKPGQNYSNLFYRPSDISEVDRLTQSVEARESKEIHDKVLSVVCVALSIAAIVGTFFLIATVHILFVILLCDGIIPLFFASLFYTESAFSEHHDLDRLKEKLITAKSLHASNDQEIEKRLPEFLSFYEKHGDTLDKALDEKIKSCDSTNQIRLNNLLSAKKELAAQRNFYDDVRAANSAKIGRCTWASQT